MVRITLNIVGLILALFGIAWILQDLSSRWVTIGAVVLLAAIVVFTSANRKKA
jgi:hypothetical protein